jgi:outer membrane protein insertion porin family
LAGLAGGAGADEGDILVAGIEVAGNRRVEDRAVLNTLALEPGSVYSPEEIRQALRRVYAMGLFDDMTLRGRETEEGTMLVLELVERPVVTTITIAGNRRIGKGDIREKLKLAVGSSLDRRLLHHSIEAITELYREKGYYVARVTADVEEPAEGAARVIFNVDEGVKVKVGDISVRGNREVEEDDIKDVMETKERGWFSRKDYNPKLFDEDMDRILRLYRDEGFRRARIVDHQAVLSEDGELANLLVTVEEGPRSYVKGVEVEILDDQDIPEAITEENLRAEIALRPGEPYSQAGFEQTMENLYSRLGDYGFVYAQIQPVEQEKGDSVGLSFRIEPERAVRVHRVIIEGNDVTFEKVIRRELVIAPGDILRRSRIERSHREIFNLGFFDDVQITSRTANPEGDIDLIFQVTERQIGNFNTGAGYSGEFGLTGFVQFSHNNIGIFRRFPYLGRGLGQTLNLRWEFGRLDQIELSFRDPWFLDRPVLIGFDIFSTSREYDTYTDRRDGLGLVLGRRIRWIDYTRLYWRYNLERREIAPEDDASDLVRSQEGERSTSSTMVSMIRSSIDNPFFPRSGSRTTLSAEWAGGWLGGNTAYQSYMLESSSYLAMPLLGSALAFKVRTGVVDELGSDGYIPVYERFRLGGTTTDGVRGYSEREIVPEGNAIDEGGRFMVLTSLEYRIPVVENKAHLLGFLDAGNTWNSLRSARPGFLKRSAGVGFRIEIPMMGQIGLDIGYGFDRDDRYGGPSWETHFQFGTAGY